MPSREKRVADSTAWKTALAGWPGITADAVPNHLPDTNPYLTEVADWYGLPLDAVRGGAETMYPEYRQKMGAPHTAPPAHCQRYCVCSEKDGCDVTPPRARRR